jgi:hypothetical protein
MEIVNQIQEAQETAMELWKATQKYDIEEVLDYLFEWNIEMTLPIPKELLDKPIVEYDMGTRLNNIIGQWCKMHCGEPRDMRLVVKLLSMGDRAREFLSGYGKGSQNRLKTFILIEAYKMLSPEAQQAFCYDLIKKNCIYEEGTLHG